ncbi:hypothetical protein Naga_101411g1, partial [Nannochloropsis gaditana]
MTTTEGEGSAVAPAPSKTASTATSTSSSSSPAPSATAVKPRVFTSRNLNPTLQAVASKSEAQAPRVALPGSTSRLTVINKPFPSPEEPGPGPGENGERGKGGGFRGRPSSWVDASLAASRASLGAPVGGGWRGKEGGRTEARGGGTEAREAGSQGRLFPLPGPGPASTDGEGPRQADEGPLANYRSPQSKGDGPSSLPPSLPSSLPPYDPSSSRAGQGKSGPPVERRTL